MRILHTFTFLSPNANGTITLVRQLATALARKEHQVGIFTADFELTTEYIDSLSPVKIHAYPSWLKIPGLYLYLSPGMVAEAKRIVKEFDILHLHCLRSLQNIVVCHYARKYGIPYVVDAHGSVLRGTEGEDSPKRQLRQLFDMAYGYRIMREASRVVAETEVGIKEYEDLGVTSEKIALISPPFAVEEFAHLPAPGQFRRQHGLDKKRIIMFLGRIHYIKGLDFLVESFSELTGVRDDVILVIVGPDDGYQATLEELIGKLNLSGRVLFTGFLRGQEKLAALVDADVVIQTSRHEQGALAPLEAVLCGTPIIVTRHTGAGEDVKRLDAGYLVEFGNKQEMVALISAILENPTKGRAKARQAAAYIRQNMSMTKRIEDYEKLYLECIAANKQLVKGAK